MATTKRQDYEDPVWDWILEKVGTPANPNPIYKKVTESPKHCATSLTLFEWIDPCGLKTHSRWAFSIPRLDELLRYTSAENKRNYRVDTTKLCGAFRSPFAIINYLRTGLKKDQNGVVFDAEHEICRRVKTFFHMSDSVYANIFAAESTLKAFNSAYYKYSTNPICFSRVEFELIRATYGSTTFPGERRTPPNADLEPGEEDSENVIKEKRFVDRPSLKYHEAKPGSKKKGHIDILAPFCNAVIMHSEGITLDRCFIIENSEGVKEKYGIRGLNFVEITGVKNIPEFDIQAYFKVAYDIHVKKVKEAGKRKKSADVVLEEGNVKVVAVEEEVVVSQKKRRTSRKKNNTESNNNDSLLSDDINIMDN